jgi:predicted Zn-dependent peptidase
MVDVYSDLMEHQQPLNSLRELPDEINALTPSTIKTLARRYLKPQHATIVVVGDLEKIAAPLQKRYGKAKILDVDGQPIAKTTGRRKK